MDYYQGVVADYITRENRSRFINPEFLLQLNKNAGPENDIHWWVDILTVDFDNKAVFLCEVTYSKSLQALSTRLKGWEANWLGVKNAIRRDAGVPEAWKVIPWVFTPAPSEDEKRYKIKLDNILAMSLKPIWTPLEAVAPWKYRENEKTILNHDALAKSASDFG